MPAEVTLVVGGKAYGNWTRYQIERDFFSPADGWSVELGDPTDAQVDAVAEGETVTLMLGNKVLLRGWVETRSLSSDRGGDRLTLAGRDLAAPLVDCSVPVSWVRTTTSLKGLAEAMVRDLGLSMTVTAEATEATEALKSARPEVGESYWELLDREAKRLELMVWVDVDGLHLGRPDYESQPVGELRRLTSGPGREANNVLRAEVAWRTNVRRSPVWIYGQADSDDDVKKSATATDPVLTAAGLKRPLVLWDGGIKSTKAAGRRAEREVAERAAQGIELHYTVPGHADASGAAWTPNTVVLVNDQRAGVSGKYWLSTVALARSRAGTTSELSLRPLYNTLVGP